MLVEDLQNYRRQFESIKTDAQSLLGDLTGLQFNWHPSPDRWSIAQCIDHLVVTGRDSLSNIHRAINQARSKGLFSQGPFRYGLMEKWFVRQMEPPARMRFKAPKAYMPSGDQSYAEIVTSFYSLQEEFLQGIDEASGIDLSRTKVSNAVSWWFRLSLGQELAFNAAHERRHLWQAWGVKKELDFPRMPTAV
ncbi:MAG: DinB family protein [Acidobacteriota bacterium]